TARGRIQEAAQGRSYLDRKCCERRLRRLHRRVMKMVRWGGPWWPVRFTEAASVFSDPLARIFPDKAHSGNEVREIIIGHSTAKLLLGFTEPVDGSYPYHQRWSRDEEQRGYEEHLAV